MSMMEGFPSGDTSITEWIREIFSSSRQRCAEASRPILMISRLNCSLRTRSSPRKTLRGIGVGMVGGGLQGAGRLHHLVAPVLADLDEVRVVRRPAGLDVLAVGALQVALDGVVLEVDDGLLLVLDLGLSAAALGRLGIGRDRRQGT